MKHNLINQLKDIGIINPKNLIYNPSYEKLFNDETSSKLRGFEKVQETVNGAVNVMTGEFTGRSPKDKYIVKDEKTTDNFWWSSDRKKNDNKPINIEIWSELKKLVLNQ